MAPAAKPIFTVQVRELVEFALRRGDLGGERDFVGPGRALAGTRGHQRLQRSRPPGYQKEVRLSFDLETPDFTLRIQGRIDGLLVSREGERPREPKHASESAEVRACVDPRPPAEALASLPEVLLEEIKTVQARWDRLADPLHWAQAKLYAYIYAQANALPHITIQLSYLDLDTGEVTEFRERCSLPDLAAFFDQTTAIYLDWLRVQHHWCRQRDQSLSSLAFPFPRYRPGQRQLAVAAYRVLARGGRLFLEAPTGIGKTMSVVFPALKALGEGKLERIFYLTARTVGRAIAQKAFADLRHAGARLRTLSLTAKEKICAQEGQPCDDLTCPFARGYYDRHKAAMRGALSREEITRPVLEEVSREHQVCPFELSLDLSTWVDVVVCDYNYVFDPKVYLRRHFAEEPGDYAFLVDEAHNLVDRAREMFSADLEVREIQDVRRALKDAVPRCAKALSRLSSAMRKLGASGADTSRKSAEPPPGLITEGPISLAEADPPRTEVLPAADSPRAGLTSRDFPADLLPPLEKALKEAETWLARNQPADFREALLQLYFRLRTFHRTAQLYDERYVTIADLPRSAGPAPTASWTAPAQRSNDGALLPARSTRRRATAVRIRLFCLDPSHLLQQALARGKAAAFFSATLTPTDYYRALLGGSEEDPMLQLPSPFPPEHLAVLVQDRIRTDFKARAASLGDVVQAIACLVEGRPGNYLAYFPSYQYLTAVQEQFHALHPAVPILVQHPGMSEAEREAFLAAFAVDHGETLLGFAVMGGVFGEGIDLVGDRLIGAVIVGVGLPQLCIERDLIRDYFQQKTGSGFEYAYTFPGMNRVLQAIGRVIRSETDRGAVLLIDTRFADTRYRRLFPPWWRRLTVRNAAALSHALNEFWVHLP
ncbi:MAG TPA: ATP-dependent DNA helicase [Candidatus Paceibacterota bacterium]|nr:ATP-dependent DNA helicase [Verrucomicrobiota bacterium]HSA10338.1 ATP-dependent DNA helicase [Candidatus Paceibacterota bacterium]